MVAYAAHTTNLNTHLLTVPKKKKSHTKEPLFRTMEVKGKRSQENGPKAQTDETAERATGLGRRTKQEIYIETWDQTDSPEIPDRGETSEIPGIPLGVALRTSTDQNVCVC